MTTRLLHIIDSWRRADIVDQLRMLAAGLTAAGYDLHICSLRRGEGSAELQAAGATVHTTPRRLSRDPWTLVQLARLVRRLRPQVMQTWLWDANLYGRTAAQAAGVRRIVAVERHLDQWKRWPHWRVDRRLARRTDTIVASSLQVRDFYTAHCVQPQRYTIIPDGIQPSALSPGARSELLEELELPATSILIALPAPLQLDSRIKDLVWALDILKWVYPQTHLLILGDGPRRRALMRYVDCVDIPERVHFLGHRADAAALLGAADYVWHAAVRDAAGQGVLQAMAAGVPVIAADTPALRQLICHEENGFLVDPGDRPAFARWTHRLIIDPALRQRIAVAGQQRAADFGPQKLIENYQRLYSELC